VKHGQSGVIYEVTLEVKRTGIEGMNGVIYEVTLEVKRTGIVASFGCGWCV